MAAEVAWVPVAGIWVRQSRPNLRGDEAAAYSARWQGAGMPAAYFADSDATAWAELYRGLAERRMGPGDAFPRDLHHVRVALERVADLSTEAVAAAARLTAGYPADEYLELARLACELPAEHPDAPVTASVRELLDRHTAYLATNPPRWGPRVPGIHLIFVAAALARTPSLPLPAPDALAHASTGATDLTGGQ